VRLDLNASLAFGRLVVQLVDVSFAGVLRELFKKVFLVGYYLVLGRRVVVEPILKLFLFWYVFDADRAFLELFILHAI
jgi:hypothetical protein